MMRASTRIIIMVMVAVIMTTVVRVRALGALLPDLEPWLCYHQVLNLEMVT